MEIHPWPITARNEAAAHAGPAAHRPRPSPDACTQHGARCGCTLQPRWRTGAARLQRWCIGGALLLASVLLAACGGAPGDSRNAPPPQAMSDEAVGHYCGMNLNEHIGPKGQILLRDRETAVWFSTIREVFAYTVLPEEPKAILAIYVQDMAQADASGNPPADAWIDARSAHFLIESQAVGGMGAPDALPFARSEDALAFAALHGGRVVSFQDMPEDYVLRSSTPASPPAGKPSGAPS